MSAPDKIDTTGKAVTFSWPEPDIALATMTRERDEAGLSSGRLVLSPLK